MGDTKVTKDLQKRELTIERVFNASRDRVWDAWTNPGELAQWWGPRGWETTIKEFDFRPSGAWHYCMKCVDENQGEFYGQESWGKALYQEINEPDSFVYEDYFSDAAGTLNKEMPVTIITMTFTEEDGKTKVTSRGVYESEAALQQVVDMGIEQGIVQTLDRLEEFVTGKE